MANALTAFKAKGTHEDLGDLTSFISSYPKSRWRPSLELNLGLNRFEYGYLTAALKHWEAAWNGAKDETGLLQRQIANRALGELVMLHARLGNMGELEKYLQAASTRTLTGSIEQQVVTARSGLWSMQNRPEISFRCGPLAVQTVLNTVKGTGGANQLIDKTESTTEGTNLAQLSDLAQKVGLDYRMAKRSKGATFIVPAVVHWKLGHFGALTAVKDDRYQIKDPTFGNADHRWLSRAALEAESDGYFLVPSGPLPAGWHPVERKEGESVWGKGNVGGIDEDSKGSSSPKVALGADGRGGGDSGAGGGNPPCGIARASAYAMQGTPNIEDTPLSYSPPVGPRIDFTLNYNYLETNQPGTFTFSNLGANWTINWVSYLTVDGSSNATVRPRGGGSEVYKYTGNPSSPYWPDMMSQALLTNPSSGTYHRELPDGTVEVFNQADGSGRIFMTQVIDPQGNSVYIQYDSNFRVTTVTDAIGQTSSISYVSNTLGNAGFYKIAQITDPFSRTCSMSYDSATTTRLLSVTDVIGLVSSFAYDTSTSFITQMTTPYGSTSFYTYQSPFSGSPPALVSGLRVVFPDGSVSVLENNLKQGLQTYYWDREAMARYPLDAINAIVTHARTTQWMAEGPSTSYTATAVPDWIKPPLENKTTFTYPNEVAGAHSGWNAFAYPEVQGNSNRPLTVSRILDNGSKQTFTYAYNSRGNVTEEIDPVGRKFTYTYASNNIDVLEKRQVRGSNNDLVGQWTYNSQHRPLVYVDGSGQRTEYAYNSFGELTELKDANGNKTTLTYDSNGYLTQINGPLAGNNDITTLTYDGFGRLSTVTDSEGYTLTYSYDAMNRITQVTYPDGTTEQTTYNRLDAVLLKDRLGRWTERSYDSMRQLAFEIDPLGRKTEYSWCACGSMGSLTDPAGNKTTWNHDLQGRVILKKYADNTTVSYVYENTTSRLKSKTDALNQTTNYVYNPDNTLYQTSYTNAVNPTSTVTLSYDPDYPRITSVKNGWGLINYAYNPYAGGSTAVSNILLGGTITTNDTISVTVTNDTLSSNPRTVNYTVQSSDTSLSILAGSVASAISGDSVLSAAGIAATASGPVVAITAPVSVGVIKVEPSVTGSETADPIVVSNVTLAGSPTTGNVVNVVVINNSLSGGTHTVQYSVTSSDTSLGILASSVATAINNDSTLSTAGITASADGSVVGIRAPASIGNISVNSNTNGVVTETIGGTVTTGDTLSIFVQDAAFGRKTLTYTVQGGDTTTSIATGLKNLVNNDTDLSTAGITATSTGAVVTMTSVSVNATTYSQALGSSTATETITQGGGPGQSASTTTTSGTGGGRLVLVRNSVIANSQTIYSYDALGRTVNRSINGSNNSVTWTYDPMSRITAESNALGNFSYTYVDDTPGSSKGTLRLASIDYPNSQVTNFSWYGNTGDQRLQRISNLNPSGVMLSQFDYAYNPAGEVTLWQQQQNGDNQYWRLEYDLAGQLIGAQVGSGSAQPPYGKQWYYAYDPAANRTAVQTSSTNTARIGGIPKASDTVTVTVFNVGLSGGQKSVVYTVQAGDTLSTIAAGLAAAITSDTDLQAIGVNATSSSQAVYIRSVSSNITTYTGSTSGTGGATETITFGIYANGIENASIGGTVTTGDTLTITVHDPGLVGGPRSVNYTVQAGDTLADIASGLASAINLDALLQVLGVSATSASAVVSISSSSTNVTTYTESVSSNATETITLSPNLNILQIAVIGGSVTASDVITLRVFDVGLSGGSKAASYTVQSGDSLSNVASGLAGAVNADTDLQGIGVSASASGTVVSLSSNSTDITSYRESTNSGATETIGLTMEVNGTQTAALGGTVTSGDTLTITVHDAGLTGGSKSVNYVVQGGDTLPTIASGMATAINNDTSLQTLGVSATAVSTVVNIKSTSADLSTYTQSTSSGATETVTLSVGTAVTKSTYNNVNELTSLSAGGATRFDGGTTKPAKSVTVDGTPATLNWSKSFSGNGVLSSGTNATAIQAIDGGNNSNTNTYQISVNSASSGTLTYDANGNLTSDGVNTYQWDAENRLIKIIYPGTGNSSQLSYDGLWRCVKIEELENNTVSSTKQIVWCGNERCEERDSSGAVGRQFYALGENVTGDSYQYTFDHLTSIRELTDSNGQIEAQYRYDPFGRVTPLGGNVGSSFQFGKYFFHSRSASSMTWMRVYVASIGRWLSRDPIGERGGINLYAYVDNVPSILRDPLGLIPCQMYDVNPDSSGGGGFYNPSPGLPAAPPGTWSPGPGPREVAQPTGPTPTGPPRETLPTFNHPAPPGSGLPYSPPRVDGFPLPKSWEGSPPVKPAIPSPPNPY